MKQKKLLIFIPSVEGGGVEKNFFLISNNLCQKFKNISVITVDKTIKKSLNNKINIIGPNSNIWRSKSRYPKYFICLVYLFIFLLFNRNTIVFSFQANAYASIISKLLFKKIITRSNSSSEGWSKNYFKIILYKILLKLPDQVIVNSYEFKKELDNKFGIKSLVIYNPLNKLEIIKKSKKKISFKFFKKNKLKLISIGRLVEQKDQFTMLKSINLLKDKKIQLLIIGQGSNQNKIQEYIFKKKLSKIIKIIPFQKNPYKYLRLADVFLLTSKFEGLPNVLLEAQCLKKYIISTDCPTGPKEILMKGALGDLIKIGDYKNLSKKIIYYIKNKKKYKKKITNAYKNLNRFDYNYNMYKYEKIIKKYIYY